MPRPSFVTRLATTLAVLAASLVAVGGTSAASPCADAILADWLEDSSIDRVYALPCYEAAIDAIPQDIEDYTDAADVIARAFQRAAGRRLDRSLEGPAAPTEPAAAPPVETSSSSSLPVPILVLGGMSAALLAAGGLGYVSRRRREGGELDG
jgi:hypothetical protein